jgi:hypothetical protein
MPPMSPSHCRLLLVLLQVVGGGSALPSTIYQLLPQPSLHLVLLPAITNPLPDIPYGLWWVCRVFVEVHWFLKLKETPFKIFLYPQCQPKMLDQ